MQKTARDEGEQAATPVRQGLAIKIQEPDHSPSVKESQRAFIARCQGLSEADRTDLRLVLCEMSSAKKGGRLRLT